MPSLLTTMESSSRRCTESPSPLHHSLNSLQQDVGILSFKLGVDGPRSANSMSAAENRPKGLARKWHDALLLRCNQLWPTPQRLAKGGRKRHWHFYLETKLARICTHTTQPILPSPAQGELSFSLYKFMEKLCTSTVDSRSVAHVRLTDRNLDLDCHPIEFTERLPIAATLSA